MPDSSGWAMRSCDNHVSQRGNEGVTGTAARGCPHETPVPPLTHVPGTPVNLSGLRSHFSDTATEA